MGILSAGERNLDFFHPVKESWNALKQEMGNSSPGERILECIKTRNLGIQGFEHCRPGGFEALIELWLWEGGISGIGGLVDVV